MRPRKLTNEQIQEIQARYRAEGGRRGIVAALAQEHEVSRGTILNALREPTTPAEPASTTPAPVSRPVDTSSPVSDAFSCSECAAPHLLPKQRTHTRWCSRSAA